MARERNADLRFCCDTEQWAPTHRANCPANATAHDALALKRAAASSPLSEAMVREVYESLMYGGRAPPEPQFYGKGIVGQLAAADTVSGHAVALIVGQKDDEIAALRKRVADHEASLAHLRADLAATVMAPMREENETRRLLRRARPYVNDAAGSFVDARYLADDIKKHLDPPAAKAPSVADKCLKSGFVEKATGQYLNIRASDGVGLGKADFSFVMDEPPSSPTFRGVSRAVGPVKFTKPLLADHPEGTTVLARGIDGRPTLLGLDVTKLMMGWGPEPVAKPRPWQTEDPRGAALG